jgi:hypothetical protein
MVFIDHLSRLMRENTRSRVWDPNLV